MPQPDLYADLRAARPLAPPSLRARVAATVAASPAPTRRLVRPRTLLVLAAALAAVVAGAAVVGRDRSGPTTAQREFAPPVASTTTPYGKAAPSAAAGSAGSALDSAVAPGPSRTRLQDYDATLSLRVRNAEALSDATKQAVRVATSLGGFASAVNVNVAGRDGDASIRLRVPVTKVQPALRRLSELGTITGESVAIRDVQPAVNAVDRRIARLQRELRALRAQEQTPQVAGRIASLTAQVERLQRSRQATVRQARLATIQLALTTRTPVAPPKPAEHGRLHGAVVALEWIGIAALYALIVAGPFVLLGLGLWLGVRAWRRHAERRLLER
jgi:hypothetical protein